MKVKLLVVSISIVLGNVLIHHSALAQEQSTNHEREQYEGYSSDESNSSGQSSRRDGIRRGHHGRRHHFYPGFGWGYGQNSSNGGPGENEFGGIVYLDRNKNGIQDNNERGVPGVLVSNGIDVVKTNNMGQYFLPIRDNMTVFITKPAGFDVPKDINNIPQFYYHHVPAGSPVLRFGGLAPTGDLPESVDFALYDGEYKRKFKMAIIGDPQPYSNTEVGYVRDTVAKELAGMDDLEGLIVEGDVMGDDLGLFPRFKEIMSVAQVPQYYVPGNHDIDFDAESDEHSFDTFRREWGPAYYSFDIGDVHFVTLDNVQYPCVNHDGQHSFCDDSANYNGYITEEQMTWLANDLSMVPMDKLVVVSMHVPLISFVDSTSNKHQTDNAGDLYNLLEGRPALALSGHTHTLEHFEPGEGARPDVIGVDIPESPFPQIIAGAACGSWWSGDFDDTMVPMSYQRLGAKRGYLLFEFDGNSYKDMFKATSEPAEKQIAVSTFSPTFTGWYQQLKDWIEAGAEGEPPVNINDLEDTSIVTQSELFDTMLTANVWNGASSTDVWVEIDNREAIKMARDENALDPFALEKQLSVLRTAVGYEMFRGSVIGPASPRPADSGLWTDRSSHVWNVQLPNDLTEGVHTAKVTAMTKHGQLFEEIYVFEVREERPEPSFRSWVFE